ncbi:MAG: adenylate/guanylate cyclase domain-containing protein [Chloroflexi bacterium]|nr:adenylate/guanylate cyclase domain-containing protein [Chloroflexota bacterium]
MTDFSPEALELDIDAVVDRLGLERFALWGSGSMGPVVIAYAVHHPERVSHLILWCTSARGDDARGSPRGQAVARLRDNWEVYTDALAHYAFGWAGGEAARQWGATMREGITQETYRTYRSHLSRADVTELLPEVRTPTLVLHRRHFPLLSVDAATDLASGIGNARLVILEGESAGYTDDYQPVLDALDEFLDDGEETARLASDDVHTILFTDVEGSTALTDRLGDAKARDLLREHEQITREALKAHGGSEVKTIGDGFMASFGSATKALECAIAIQRSLAERNESAEEAIRVRIGLNAGEPIAEDDPGGHSDLYGTAVNMAARIAAKAEGGQILVPVVVRELVAGKEFLFADCGDTELRGFEDPVRVFEVRWRE